MAVGVREGEQQEDNTYIDYDEMDSLLKGIDYLSKVDFTGTSLTGFEAVNDRSRPSHPGAWVAGTVPNALVKSGR